jgi:hypothetical protein
MDFLVPWFRDRVKRSRQAAFWRVRNEDWGDGYVIPPVLSDGRTDPFVPTSADSIEFRVNAISAGLGKLAEGIDTVTLSYRIRGGPTLTQAMARVSSDSHDGDYSFLIAPQSEGATIEYWFETTDDLALTDRFPETGSLYTEVVDDPTGTRAYVTITEIMYHSDLPGNEWVEIHNSSDRWVDVSRWILGDSNPQHRFRLPVDLSLAPGGRLTIAANEFVVREQYGIENVVGDFDFNLGNAGDTVALFDSTGASIDSVAFTDDNPWPIPPDGYGPSLELVDGALDNSDPGSWVPSFASRGTPGEPNGSFPEDTPSETPTLTFTPTATATASGPPSPTSTSTPTPSFSPTFTPVSTETFTHVPPPTPTFTPSATQSECPTETLTSTGTETPSTTPVPTVTVTATSSRNYDVAPVGNPDGRIDARDLVVILKDHLPADGKWNTLFDFARFWGGEAGYLPQTDD